MPDVTLPLSHLPFLPPPSRLPVADSLKTLDPTQFAKWTIYLQLKAAFYESYVCLTAHILTLLTTLTLYPQAYCFLGQELLTQEKCGESIRSLLHSQSCMLIVCVCVCVCVCV